LEACRSGWVPFDGVAGVKPPWGGLGAYKAPGFFQHPFVTGQKSIECCRLSRPYRSWARLLNSVCPYSRVSVLESSLTRLTQPKKAEFTKVNENFLGKRLATGESGLYRQTLNNAVIAAISPRTQRYLPLWPRHPAGPTQPIPVAGKNEGPGRIEPILRNVIFQNSSPQNGQYKPYLCRLKF
jgi:hypothetical protein